MSHIAPKRLYFTIFAALIALTLATVGITYVDLGEANLIVAMGIAITKATLVVLYFMHVRYASRLTWLVVGSGVVWFAILVLFTMADVLTRT